MVKCAPSSDGPHFGSAPDTRHAPTRTPYSLHLPMAGSDPLAPRRLALSTIRQTPHSTWWWNSPTSPRRISSCSSSSYVARRKGTDKVRANHNTWSRAAAAAAARARDDRHFVRQPQVQFLIDLTDDKKPNYYDFSFF